MKLPIPNTTKLGFVGIFRMSIENVSIMVVSLTPLTLLFLKETQHLKKGQIITATHLILMVTNDINMVVIIFDLILLNSNMLIPESMVDVEEMLGVVVAMVE